MIPVCYLGLFGDREAPDQRRTGAARLCGEADADADADADEDSAFDTRLISQ